MSDDSVEPNFARTKTLNLRHKIIKGQYIFHSSIHPSIHVYTYIYMYIHVCMNIHIRIRMYVHTVIIVKCII